VDFVERDLNHVDLDTEMKGIDVIFHLAGQPGVRRSWGSEFRVSGRGIRAATGSRASTGLEDGLRRQNDWVVPTPRGIGVLICWQWRARLDP
jgi:hypothetical protein